LAVGGIAPAGTKSPLARETLQLGRLQFDAGDADLVTLNIYEKSVTDAQVLRISAQADFFSALADYRAALAIDPLAEESQDQR
jgi:outer membrane protein TolC